MADMVDCGAHTFKAWARQTPSPAHGVCWYDLWLGEFNPRMTADEAARRLEVDKLTHSARASFKRGWEKAQTEHVTARSFEEPAQHA